MDTTKTGLYVEFIRLKIKQLSEAYDQMTGISETRQLQSLAAEAERKLREVSKQRRLAQEELDLKNDRIREFQERRDTTPRTSDMYMDLMKAELDLAKQRPMLEQQLKNLSSQEQESFELSSKLLARSQENERLRQERSKYWQIISIVFSLFSTTILIFKQKIDYDRRAEEKENRMTDEAKRVFLLLEQSKQDLTEMKAGQTYLVSIVEDAIRKLDSQTKAEKSDDNQWLVQKAFYWLPSFPRVIKPQYWLGYWTGSDNS